MISCVIDRLPSSLPAFLSKGGERDAAAPSLFQRRRSVVPRSPDADSLRHRAARKRASLPSAMTQPPLPYPFSNPLHCCVRRREAATCPPLTVPALSVSGHFAHSPAWC